MQQVENTNTRKSLRNNVCEDGGGGARVHRRKGCGNVVELREGVDNNKDIGRLQPNHENRSDQLSSHKHIPAILHPKILENSLARIPKHHPGRNTKVPHGIKRHEIHHRLQLRRLMRFRRIKLVQAPQPGQLEQLLREEEGSDAVRIGAEEGDVLVVHVQHVGRAEHAILLRGEVDDKGGWREPFCGAD